MLWIESAGDIYLNRKNHVHFKKDALLIVCERIILCYFFNFYRTCLSYMSF